MGEGRGERRENIQFLSSFEQLDVVILSSSHTLTISVVHKVEIEFLVKQNLKKQKVPA